MNYEQLLWSFFSCFWAMCSFFVEHFRAKQEADSENHPIIYAETFHLWVLFYVFDTKTTIEFQGSNTNWYNKPENMTHMSLKLSLL